MSLHRRLLLLLAVLGLVAAACGTDDEGGGASASSPGSDAAGEAFPVTIAHAFGETEIPEAPTRVVTWGWATADAAIALGVVPVAMPFQDYGGDDKGVLPWIREALEEQGEEIPEILPDAEEAPIEAIAAAAPDLILAHYSGITEDEYELLSQIAPTVAFPDQPWSTPWRDVIEIAGEALGRGHEATALLADIDGQIAAEAEAHPELEGKTVALVWDTGDAFYVYKFADPRAEFTLDLGLEPAPSVTELETDESTFYFTLSKERLGSLTSDILVSYADTEAGSRTFLDSAPAQLMAQVRSGAVAEVVGTELIAAVSPPTALSLTWRLAEYADLLGEAAAKVGSAG